MTSTMSLPRVARRMRVLRRAIAAGAVIALPALPALARAQASAYSLPDVLGLVKNKVPAKRVLALVKENCLSFHVDDDARAQLLTAGATASLVDDLKSACGPDNPRPPAPSPDSARPPAAPAAPAAATAAAPPPDTIFPVKFRAAVVGADITVRPVPQMDLLIVSAHGDTARTSTDLDGNAEGSFQEGVYHIESARSVTIGNVRYHWAFDQPFSRDMRPVELTQKNAIIDTIAAVDSAVAPAPPPKPAKHENVERDIFARYASGVFTVFGAARGTGFLVDSAGLVVTNAHLVKGAGEVRVQIDSATKVYATPVVTDDDRDIAVLAINMRHCGGCAVLPLFDSSASTAPAAGDRVLALGSPLNRLSVLSIGVISSANATALVSDAGVNWLNTGGPLLSLDGFVIGLNSTKETQLALADVGAGPRVTSSVPVAQVVNAVQRARSALASRAAHTPGDSLLPVLPTDPFPKAPIDAVSALASLDLHAYRTGDGPFHVLVMTPQIMAWRQAQAGKALADRRQHDPRKAALWRRIDPIEGWRDWHDYLDDRRAVVIVNVMPDGAAFPFYDADRIRSFDAGDFSSLVITRDGVPIVPVEEVRIPAVLNVDEMRASGKQVPMQGIYVYRIRDFAPRAVGTTASYVLRILDAAPGGKAVTISMAPAMIEQLWKDFTPYRFP